MTRDSRRRRLFSRDLVYGVVHTPATERQTDRALERLAAAGIARPVIRFSLDGRFEVWHYLTEWNGESAFLGAGQTVRGATSAAIGTWKHLERVTE